MTAAMIDDATLEALKTALAACPEVRACGMVGRVPHVHVGREGDEIELRPHVPNDVGGPAGAEARRPAVAALAFLDSAREYLPALLARLAFAERALCDLSDESAAAAEATRLRKENAKFREALVQIRREPLSGISGAAAWMKETAKTALRREEDES